MSAKWICVVALTAWLGADSAKAEGTNLLRNSGFEEDCPSCWGMTGTTLRLERASWHPRTGRWSFGIGNDEGPMDASGGIVQQVALPDVATAGRKCYFSVWSKMENRHTGTLLMKLEFLGENGQTLQEVSRPAGATMRGSWQMVRIYGIIPAGAQQVRAACVSEHMKSGEGQSFIWLDDAALTVE